MIYVGVDIGKDRHAAAAVNEAGESAMPPFYFTQDAGGFAALFGALEKLGGPGAAAVGMEATGHYWKVLRHALAGRGYRVDVINPLITSHEASADVRGRKSDKLDAIAIANVMRKGGYSPAPAAGATDALRTLARYRRTLVARRSDAKNRLAAALDAAFPEAAKTLSGLSGAAAMAAVRAFPSARLAAKADIRTVTSVFKKASGGRLGREDAKKFREAARHSLSLGMHTGRGARSPRPSTRSRPGQQIDRVGGACKSRAELRPGYVIKGAGRIQPLAIARSVTRAFAGAGMAEGARLRGMRPESEGERKMEGEDKDVQARQPHAAQRALSHGDHRQAAHPALQRDLQETCRQGQAPQRRPQPCHQKNRGRHVRHVQDQH